MDSFTLRANQSQRHYTYVCVGGPQDGALVESEKPLTHFDVHCQHRPRTKARYVCVTAPVFEFDDYIVE